MRAFSSVVEQAAHNCMVAGSIPARPTNCGGVVELVYTGVLSPPAVRHAGSSPATPTKQSDNDVYYVVVFSSSSGGSVPAIPSIHREGVRI